MRTRNRWYVVFALIVGVALGMGMAPLVDPVETMYEGETLRVVVFDVDKTEPFKTKLSVDTKNRTVTAKHGKLTLTVSNPENLITQNIKDGTLVCVHGYREQDDNKPHEYIGHVTVVR